MAGQQVSDWILLMAFSGGRMNEVLSLQWGDIDFAVGNSTSAGRR